MTNLSLLPKACMISFENQCVTVLFAILKGHFLSHIREMIGSRIHTYNSYRNISIHTTDTNICIHGIEKERGTKARHYLYREHYKNI